MTFAPERNPAAHSVIFFLSFQLHPSLLLVNQLFTHLAGHDSHLLHGSRGVMQVLRGLACRILFLSSQEKLHSLTEEEQDLFPEGFGSSEYRQGIWYVLGSPRDL